MISNVSYLILLLALACAAYAAIMALLSVWRQRPGWLASAHRAALLTVASVSNRTMPLYLKITAVWGGQSGSLLFWAWLMASFGGAAMLRKWERDHALLPYVIIVMMVTLAFFLGLAAVFENPFARLWQTTKQKLRVWPFPY